MANGSCFSSYCFQYLSSIPIHKEGDENKHFIAAGEIMVCVGRMDVSFHCRIRWTTNVEKKNQPSKIVIVGYKLIVFLFFIYNIDDNCRTFYCMKKIFRIKEIMKEYMFVSHSTAVLTWSRSTHIEIHKTRAKWRMSTSK